MNKEEILEYNKRCAEFLNMKFEEFDLGCYDYRPLKFYGYLSQMKFHSDWNWIMEVVEAIDKLPYTCVYFSKTYLGKHKVEISLDTPSYLLKAKKNTVFVENEFKKEAVVQAINQFLIWYNETKL